MITDAIVFYFLELFGSTSSSWTNTSIAFWNGGGIRAPIAQGSFLFIICRCYDWKFITKESASSCSVHVNLQLFLAVDENIWANDLIINTASLNLLFHRWIHSGRCTDHLTVRQHGGKSGDHWTNSSGCLESLHIWLQHKWSTRSFLANVR